MSIASPLCWSSDGEWKHIGIDARVEGGQSSKEGIVDEKYGTIEFMDPSYALLERLWMGPAQMADSHPFYEKYWKHKVVRYAETEQEMIGKMAKCHQELIRKLQESNEELKRLMANGR